MKKYDVIVIGSGGGTKISTPAAIQGYKAAIIEEWKLGGTCLNRGCIPSKMMIHPANVATAIKEAKKFGINAKYNSVDFAKLTRRINKTTDADSNSIAKSYRNAKNLDYYHDSARFVSDKVIEVAGEKITADRIVIAAGARPNIAPIEGLDKVPYMTSTEALHNRKLPKKLLIIGGGYIACELGHAYASFGSDVHFIVRSDCLLQREDTQLAREYTKAFAKKHNIHFSTTPYKVEYKNKRYTIYVKSKRGKKSKITGDGLLVATGVKPNSDALGLENTNVKTDKRGFIRVNKYLETGAKNVFAIGDIVGNYMFRHSVNYEGEHLFRAFFVGKKKKPMKYPPMPHAVFTHPEIAAVGKTEEELKEAGVDYVVGFNTYVKSAQGMARLSENDFCKLLFDRKTKKLLGAHIMGEEAATMIHQLIYAMTNNAKLDDILNMIYIHPALPEIVRNAARNAKAELV